MVSKVANSENFKSRNKFFIAFLRVRNLPFSGSRNSGGFEWG